MQVLLASLALILLLLVSLVLIMIYCFYDNTNILSISVDTGIISISIDVASFTNVIQVNGSIISISNLNTSIVTIIRTISIDTDDSSTCSISITGKIVL